MTIDEIKKWMLESSGFPVTQANAEYLERFQAIAFQAGAASRDAEIQRLQFALADSEALELGTAERCDQLRAELAAEQANNTRLRDFIASAQVSSGVCCCGEAMDGHSSPMSCGHSPVDMWDHAVENLLDAPSDTSTPEQSLAEYRNKVIEECAKRAEAYAYMSQNFNALAEELRAMKEQP